MVIEKKIKKRAEIRFFVLLFAKKRAEIGHFVKKAPLEQEHGKQQSELEGLTDPAASARL